MQDVPCGPSSDFGAFNARAFVGDTVTFCLKVQNSGSLNLYDVAVTCDGATPLNFNDDISAVIPSGGSFIELGGDASKLDLPAGSEGYLTIAFPSVLIAADLNFSFSISGNGLNSDTHSDGDYMNIIFSDVAHLVFVRHEFSENLQSLLPYLAPLSRCENVILPFWRPTWPGGSTNQILQEYTKSTILGQTQKEFQVSTTDRKYNKNSPFFRHSY